MRKYKRKEKLKQILKPGTDSVEQDPYDKKVFGELFETQKIMNQEQAKLEKFYPPIKDLNQDVYASLYKYSPKYVPQEFLKSTHKLNHNIIKKLSEAHKHGELRESTKLDPVLSMLGTSNLQEEVKKILEEEKEELEKMQQAIQDAQDLVDQLSKSQDGADKDNSGEAGKAPGSGPSVKDEEKLTLEEAKKKLEEELNKVDEFTEKHFKRTKVNNMMQRTSQEVQEVSEMISQWGLDRSTTYQYAGHEEKLSLLDQLRNSRTLKEIAEYLGRLKMLKFREGRDKTKKGYQEITDVTTSNRIDKMLVSEYNSLLDEDLQLLFLQKYNDNKLLIYKLKSKNKNERGPVVACIDSSGVKLLHLI